ncbi:MAG: phytanoyl-CoA dioxygenase family protein [Akkermansiaceae bacterium]|nr:phytanoyl-CoA dioxygenase family protein [Akkermansiaceae bacterium]
MNSPNTDPGLYDAEGYCLFEDVLNAGEIGAVRADLEALIRGMPETMVVYKDGEHKEVAARPEYLTEPHSKQACWLELCRHPRVLDAVESVLGPDLILIMSHLIVKRPGDGLPVAWHQDNTYWHSVVGTDVATVWLAIDDADLANGCMQVIPCSHEGYPEMEKVPTGENDLLGLTVEVTDQMAAAAVPLEMKAGSMSIHDSYVLHGSEPNSSGRRRAAYTMRYANARTVRVDVSEHWVPVYLVRGEGGPHAGDYTNLRPGQPVPDLVTS